MIELLKLIERLSADYGLVTVSIILAIFCVLYIVYVINKNYSCIIKKYLEEKITTNNREHTDAAIYRKRITPKIRKELNHLAECTNADRTLLFEFSNGSSNLVGLPFLYLTATCEVVTSKTTPVSHLYQRVNTSLVASFLEKLEEKGYFYVKDIETIKYEFPTLYAFMKPNQAKSLLFYSLMGVDDTIGFVVATTVKDKTFEREHTLPKIAYGAQVISSLLNFNTLQEDA